ncbi:MAG: hypothetical protein PHQ62_03640 [Clostridia bacterium]|nr:hypothetical protein [Clostridia bacterium]
MSGIEGYKVCYNNNNYELDNTFSIYAEFVLKELYANFGILNDETHSSSITNKANENVASNYDKIRVQTLENNTTTNIPWKWTFSTQTSNLHSLENSETAVQTYSNQTVQSNYYSAFVNTYKVALEIVLMQIIMDETPTIFTIEINDSEGTTKIFFDTAKQNEITNDNCLALTQTKTQFAEKGEYVGLKPEDVQILNNYILINIVGNDIINSVYNQIQVGSEAKNYSYITNQILTVSPDLAKSIFEPYPTSTIKDITDSSFYVSTSSTDAMSHIQAKEYQSFVIMPSSTTKICSVWLAIEAEYNVNINIKVNYYNFANKTYTNISTQTAELTNKKWSVQNSVNFDIDFINLSTFDNSNQALSASTEKLVSNTNQNSVLYNVNTANVGVLNYQAINQSYIELVFEIEKDNSKTYWPFKAGIALMCSI